MENIKIISDTIGYKLLDRLLNKNEASKKILDQLFQIFKNKNRYPKVVISEDASGRILGNIFKRVLYKISQKSNQPKPILMPLPIGRDTSEESSKKIVSAIQDKITEEPEEDILYVTDTIDSGKTLGKFLSEITLPTGSHIYVVSLGYDLGFRKLNASVTLVGLVSSYDGDLRRAFIPKPIRRESSNNTLRNNHSKRQAQLRRLYVDAISEAIINRLNL